MLTEVKLEIGGLSADLIKVKQVNAHTDNMTTAMVCNLYIDLCTKIAEGIVPTSTSLIVKRLEAERKDAIDREERHNINVANRPSQMQIDKYEKENLDEDM